MWWLLLAACGPSGRGRVPEAPAPITPPADPVAGTPTLRVTPDDPIFGRDELVCHASNGAAVSWTAPGVPGPATGVVPAGLARRARTWTCTAEGAAPLEVTPRVAATNVLVLLLDDVGRDRLRAFGGTDSQALTPAIDALVAEGVVFEHAWSEPVCSATRASLLTGRTPRRHDVGDLVERETDVSLSVDEVLVSEAVRLAGWSDAYLGKWHLGSVFDGPLHPLDAGVGTFHGTVGNLEMALTPDPPRPLDYFRWEQNDDGVLAIVEGYATARVVEDAEAVLPTLPEPWFAVVAPNAIHTPFQAPPEEWVYSPQVGPFSQARTADWMVESVDLAVARILAATPPDTTVVLMADNGSMPEILSAPYAPLTGKGTTLEGGINVPMVVTGPLVARPGVSRALVQVTDVFDTVLAIAGLTGADVDAALPEAAARPRDSISFLPSLADPDAPGAREIAFSERYEPNGPAPWSLDTRAARDARFKLVELWDATAFPPTRTRRLYDLGDDAVEGDDLLTGEPLSAEAQDAMARLGPVLDAATGDLP